MKNEVALRKEERFGGELYEVTRECKDVEEVFERYKNVAEIVYYKNFKAREDIKDDLLQEGMIEIWRKANKYFEYENKNEWKNYIYKSVKFAMIKFFRAFENVVHGGEDNEKISKIKNEVKKGEEIETVCKKVNFKKEHYLNSLMLNNNTFSLEGYYLTENNCEEIEIVDQKTVNIGEEMELKELINDIVNGVWNKKMKTTKEELKNILFLYEEGMNDTEISQITGIARKTIYDHRVRFKKYLCNNGY